RARREAAADRHTRVDHQIEPADFWADAVRETLHVVEPAAPRPLLAETVLDDTTAELPARGTDAGVVAAPDGGGRSLRDRRREDQAPVVVGVLADQVHAAGGVRDHIRRPAEHRGE